VSAACLTGKLYGLLLFPCRAVLENHHASLAFALLRKPKCNFVSKLSYSQSRQFREHVIELILATDFAQHIIIINQFSTAWCGGPSVPHPTSQACTLLCAPARVDSRHAFPFPCPFRSAPL
jgi:hypothetical protein